jgi:hypothetical protein
MAWQVTDSPPSMTGTDRHCRGPARRPDRSGHPDHRRTICARLPCPTAASAAWSPTPPTSMSTPVRSATPGPQGWRRQTGRSPPSKRRPLVSAATKLEEQRLPQGTSLDEHPTEIPGPADAERSTGSCLPPALAADQRLAVHRARRQTRSWRKTPLRRTTTQHNLVPYCPMKRSQEGSQGALSVTAGSAGASTGSASDLKRIAPPRCSPSRPNSPRRSSSRILGVPLPLPPHRRNVPGKVGVIPRQPRVEATRPPELINRPVRDG